MSANNPNRWWPNPGLAKIIAFLVMVAAVVIMLVNKSPDMPLILIAVLALAEVLE